MSKTIFGKVKLSFIHLHRWPEALPPYDYLQHLHRHEFYLNVTYSQIHTNRDIEYHQLKDWLIWSVNDWKQTWPEEYSCESMAEEILDHLLLTWGKDRSWEVEVLEDGECGGTCTYVPIGPIEHTTIPNNLGADDDIPF